MTGPEPYKALLTGLLVVMISVSSICTVELELAKSGHYEIIIINVILFIVCLFGWARASFCDPGTIPHRSNFIHRLLFVSPCQEKWLQVNGAELFNMKFCRTCEIYRPPRAVHCVMCDTCIVRMDHHCPWLGTCIGRNNYIYFAIFICSIVAMTILNIAAGIFNLWRIKDPRIDNQIDQIAYCVKKSPQSVAFICIYFAAGVFPLILQVYHTYLWLFNKGKTTNESCKGR